MQRLSPWAALLLLGCAAESAPADPCVSQEANYDHLALSVDVSLTRGFWGGEEVIAGPGPIDCALVELTDAGGYLAAEAMSPSSLDLAPGTYGAEASWSDGDTQYRSEVVEVQHEEGGAHVELTLCADLSGDWSCTGGVEDQVLMAEARGACAIEFSEWPDQPMKVVGDVILGETCHGLVDDGVLQLSAPHADLDCVRL
jgi:hypothetical protein